MTDCCALLIGDQKNYKDELELPLQNHSTWRRAMAARSCQSGRFRPRGKIPVVCVSSHQHALEHIHDVLRRRRLLQESWSMLHFDSHADLACPGEHIPALCCFRPRRGVRVTRPADMENTKDDEDDEQEDQGNDDENMKNLYELLDTTQSGIAEWILPLVLAANLRAVHWIRPDTTVRLIPSGRHTYHVGAWIPQQVRNGPNVSNIGSFLDLPETALVRVDWNCRYYSEDGSFVPRNELVLAKPLRLSVEERPSPGASSESQTGIQNDVDDCLESESIFALDVCLDYFACLNPFVSDMEALDKDFACALFAAVIEAELYKQDDVVEERATDCSHGASVASFRSLLQDFLEACADNQVEKTCVLENEVVRQLLSFYVSQERGRYLIDAIVISLQTIPDEKLRLRLIQLATEALPNLTMPHEEYLSNNSARTVEHGSIQLRLETLRDVIRTNRYHSRDPFIITIARSSDDGFTPTSVVEELQDSVLSFLHERYCGCGAPNLQPPGSSGGGSDSESTDCRFDLIFDYGEWEGSTFPA